MLTKQERSNYVDNLKGVLIFLVVFGHLIESYTHISPLIKYFYVFIYLFHMPLFAFCSGYLAKQTIAYKKIFKYFLFYLVLQAITVIAKVILNGSFDVLWLLVPDWVLWYLLSLTFWLIALKNLKKINLITVLLAFAIGLAVGYIEQIGIILSLSRTITLLPFFILGFYLKQNPLNYLKIKQKLKYILPILFVGILIFLYLYLPSINITDLYFKNAYSYDTQIFERFAIYIFAIILSIQLALLIPQKEMILFNTYGKQTLSIYLFHAITVTLIELFVLNISDYLILILSFFISLLIFQIFSMSKLSINRLLK